MKLQAANTGHNLLTKMKLGMFAAVTRDRAPDVLRLLLYRPELFGRPFMLYVEAVLRGESTFTVGERELFAAYVSKLNRCDFCYGSHFAVAARAMGAARVEGALTDIDASDLSDRVKGAIKFLGQLTPAPASMKASHVRTAYAAGLTRDEVEQLVHLCTVFCTINSLADSLGFEVPSAATFERMAGPLLKHGYVL